MSKKKEWMNLDIIFLTQICLCGSSTINIQGKNCRLPEVLSNEIAINEKQEFTTESEILTNATAIKEEHVKNESEVLKTIISNTVNQEAPTKSEVVTKKQEVKSNIAKVVKDITPHKLQPEHNGSIPTT